MKCETVSHDYKCEELKLVPQDVKRMEEICHKYHQLKKKKNQSSTRQRREAITKPAAEGTGIPYDLNPSQSPTKTKTTTRRGLPLPKPRKIQQYLWLQCFGVSSWRCEPLDICEGRPLSSAPARGSVYHSDSTSILARPGLYIKLKVSIKHTLAFSCKVTATC